jgi:hypothetical protein
MKELQDLTLKLTILRSKYNRDLLDLLEIERAQVRVDQIRLMLFGASLVESLVVSNQQDAA